MEHLYREFDNEIITTVTKAIANTLAEKSGRLSLICFADGTGGEKLVQFRMRRGHLFRSFDLRDVLQLLNIANGGGHEGAIGFRFPRNSIPDMDAYVAGMIPLIEQAVGHTLKA
jgi:nanoRNase/pAp phosphatase (c-di-AMP/oligoRNAs hydrolase)